MANPPKDRSAAEAEAEAQGARAVQTRMDQREEEREENGANEGAMQAGARHYPEGFPEQHLAKPGEERAMDPAPMYEAPYYKGSEKLAGKVAIITGGDSGIGRAVAVLFAREGADVAVLYLTEDSDAQETKEAVEKEGRRCLLISGDVSSAHFCEDAARTIHEAFGRIDVLVNNAAFQLHAKDISEIDDDHFDRTMKTNLYGYFYMARAALRYMESGASIVMSGSVTGINGSGQLLDYSMTKGGIHAFARSLASSLVPRGIRVNVVAPGPVWTPLNPADRPAEQVAKFGGKSVMRRAAQPEEIAPAYVFLASSHCSSYITGEILPVIGGY